MTQYLKRINNLVITIAAVILLCAGMPSFAWAACVATCAVTETTKLDFSTLQQPSSGSVTYTVAPDGTAASGTATVLYGTAVRGQYKATRTGSTTGCTGTTYDVQSVSSGNAGVTLGTWKGRVTANASLPMTLGTFPATTGTTFFIGATATITSSATTGSFAPSYNVVCTIQ